MLRSTLLLLSFLAIGGFWPACSDGDDGYGPYPPNEFTCSACEGGDPYEPNNSLEACEVFGEVNECLEIEFSAGNCLAGENPSCTLFDCEFEPDPGWCGP